MLTMNTLTGNVYTVNTGIGRGAPGVLVRILQTERLHARHLTQDVTS